MKRLGISRCNWAWMSSATSLGGRLSFSLRCAAHVLGQQLPSQARHLLRDQRQAGPPFLDAALEGGLVGGQRLGQEGAVQRQRDDLLAQFLQRAQAHVGSGHLLQVGDVLFQVLQRLLDLQRHQPAQPGAVLRGRHLGLVEDLDLDTVAAVHQRREADQLCAPRRISISSGSSPKLHVVWRAASTACVARGASCALTPRTGPSAGAAGNGAAAGSFKAASAWKAVRARPPSSALRVARLRPVPSCRPCSSTMRKFINRCGCSCSSLKSLRCTASCVRSRTAFSSASSSAPCAKGVPATNSIGIGRQRHQPRARPLVQRLQQRSAPCPSACRAPAIRSAPR